MTKSFYLAKPYFAITSFIFTLATLSNLGKFTHYSAIYVTKSIHLWGDSDPNVRLSKPEKMSYWYVLWLAAEYILANHSHLSLRQEMISNDSSRRSTFSLTTACFICLRGHQSWHDSRPSSLPSGFSTQSWLFNVCLASAWRSSTCPSSGSPMIRSLSSCGGTSSVCSLFLKNL